MTEYKPYTDYYDILHIEPSADEEDIEAAFQERVKSTHPDTNNDMDGDLLIIVQDAREVLLNDRERYDQYGHNKYIRIEGGRELPLGSSKQSGNTSSDDIWSNKKQDKSSQADDSEEYSYQRQKRTKSNESTRNNDTISDNIWSNRKQDKSSETNDSEEYSHQHQKRTRSNESTRNDEKLSDEGYNGAESTTDAQESSISKRFLLLAGIGGAGYYFAGGPITNALSSFATDLNGDGTASGSDSGPERVEIGPDDSIQSGINNVALGGTVIVNPGVYNESININKKISIVAPDGAELVGRGESAGITVSGNAVDLQGFTISDYSKGIQTAKNVNHIKLTGTIIKNNSGNAVDADVDSMTIQDLSAENNGGGINCNGNSISIENATITKSGSESAAIYIKSSPEGQVSINKTNVRGSSPNGIMIKSGSEVSITGTNCLGNDGYNISVTGGNALGQEIELIDCVTDGGYRGIRILGTSGSDAVQMNDITVNNHRSYGIYMTSDNISVENAEVNNNNSGDYVDNPSIRIDANSVDISNLQALNNGVGDVDAGAVSIDCSSDGEVLMNSTEVRKSSYAVIGQSSSIPGILITGGKDVVLQDVEATGNTGTNVRVEQSNITGRSIEISDSLVSKSVRGDGVYTSTGVDEKVIIEDVQAIRNSDYGFNIGAESVRISDSRAENNSAGGGLNGGPLNLRNTNRESAEIVNSDV